MKVVIIEGRSGGGPFFVQNIKTYTTKCLAKKELLCIYILLLPICYSIHGVYMGETFCNVGERGDSKPVKNLLFIVISQKKNSIHDKFQHYML